jgi:hypothetical protein
MSTVEMPAGRNPNPRLHHEDVHVPYLSHAPSKERKCRGWCPSCAERRSQQGTICGETHLDAGAGPVLVERLDRVVFWIFLLMMSASLVYAICTYGGRFRDIGFHCFQHAQH